MPIEQYLSGDIIDGLYSALTPITAANPVATIADIPASGGCPCPNATFQATPADPIGGTSSAAGVMMGLAGSITPANSGKVMIVISGDYENVSGDSGCAAQMYTGTGVAPVNGAVIVGTPRGGLVTMRIIASGSTSSSNRTPFSLNCVITGLIVGTPYWIDISLARTGGASTATAANISISAIEI